VSLTLDGKNFFSLTSPSFWPCTTPPSLLGPPYQTDDQLGVKSSPRMVAGSEEQGASPLTVPVLAGFLGLHLTPEGFFLDGGFWPVCWGPSPLPPPLLFPFPHGSLFFVPEGLLRWRFSLPPITGGSALFSVFFSPSSLSRNCPRLFFRAC